MADPRNPALAISFLFLVLVPQMAVSGKFPRFTMSPRQKKQLGQYFKDHASEMSNVFPSQSQSSSGGGGQSEPGAGGGSNSAGRDQPGASGSSNGDGGSQQQAAATTAGKYTFSFDVGTPPQSVSGVLDISSDLVWTQCGTTSTELGTGSTLFAPSKTSSMAVVPCTSTTCQRFVAQTCDSVSAYADPKCSYSYTYGGGTSITYGYLATETFRFDNDTAADPVKVVFGCALASVGDLLDGVIGLGRGPYSLVSQLQAGRFSYYFAPDGDVSSGTDSFIHFGDDAAPLSPSRVASTPLLANRAYPHLYYVGLRGIRVDGQDLAIPRGTFDLQTDGSGGVILSITIPVTYLDEAAYKVVRAAVVSKVGLPTVDGSLLGLDLCYASQSLAAAKIPAMALVFDGDDAVMELQTSNYFYLDAATGLECLAIIPATAGSGSLLGNLIQAGTHMIYDISGSKLMFESLQQATPSTTSHGKGSPLRSSSAPAARILPVVAANFVWFLVYMLYWAAF